MTTRVLRWLLPAVVCSAILAVYVASLDGDVGFWDTGELQTVPYILGIAHPTGYPANTLLGWLFTHAVPLGSVAWRTALLCALCYVAALYCLYALVARLSGNALAAAGATLLTAFTPLVWRYATHSDVFAVTVALVALAVLLLFEWRRTGRRGALVASGVAYGLALGSHLTALWLLPGLVVLLVTRSWTARTILTAAASVVAGTLVYAYLPLASMHNYALRRDPTLGLGIAPGRPFWDYAHPSTLHNFVWLVTGAQVNAGASVLGALGGALRGGNLMHAVALLMGSYPTVLLILAALGVAWLWRANGAATAVGLLLCVAGGVPFTGQFAQESDPVRYWLVPAWLLGIFVGMGLAATLTAAQRYMPARVAQSGLAVIVLAICAFEQVTSRHLYVQRENHLGATYIADVRAATPENAIVIAPWVLATPLAYASYVEHAFGDRTLDVAVPETDAVLLPRWLQSRRVFAVGYVAPNLPGVRVTLIRRLDLDPNLAKDAKLWELTAPRPGDHA